MISFLLTNMVSWQATHIHDTIRIMTNNNLLICKHPDLIISEWDYELNIQHDINVNTITCGSGVKVWWHCESCNGKYDMIVKDKVKGQGCPYCAGKRVLRGFNDLQSNYPELIASSWDWTENDKHGLKPYSVTSRNGMKAYWHCNECNSKYDMLISDKIHGIGCPYCAGKRVLRGFNDLLTLQPELIKTCWDYADNNANGLHPDAVTTGSGLKARWHCNACNGSYMMRIADRTSGHGCPYCAGNKVLKGFNDLQSNYPELIASEWDYRKNNMRGIHPDAITCNSSVEASWSCSHGHSWNAVVSNRIGRGSGCPKCSHKISEQENQVAEFMNDYLCSHYADMKYSMMRSIKFKRIYKNLGIDADSVLSDGLQSHLMKEIDIYIPELNLAVEYDGDYWHDDKIMMETRGMTNSESHRIKQELCRQAGIELFFISEHDWLNENWKVKSMLQSLITSYISMDV